ncbi:ABC transporter permease [Streptomyces calvus]|jgi:NitT/TauT family transport system permease protein|uniref:NitT/TauT family transport system permease protein n=1 Tax=Streptomyces calvus TaxID=67282 RepID=A0AA40SL31_9ACTN|nr:ABC transporter permease [Streptomyces calvus]MBA8948220.1 NitT/TauT family transport system permease protein [Streptomyces calvus]GGP85121.1 sulfate ABC transporter permease [Streptomyces calvus]
MGGTDTGTARPAGADDELAGLEAGLDSLETQPVSRVPVRQVLRQKVAPPLLGAAVVLAVWQLLHTGGLVSEERLPTPRAVGDSFLTLWRQGTLFEIVWTSLERGLLGFLAALAIGTPLGLVVARVPFVRATLQPVLSGLQSLPSVAWVPAAIIWFGLTDAAMYTVILLGAVPSIAVGLVSGIDQVPPLYLRAGRTIGATGLRGARHIVLPAALPGYTAGLKQGWAFSWRSLMATELIASSPELGVGLGRYLANSREAIDLPGVFFGILLILAVGVLIDLLVFSPLERRVLRSRGLAPRN